MPTDYRASSNHFEVASRAHAMATCIAGRQSKEAQDGLAARRADQPNEVRVVPAQSVRPWAGIPAGVGGVAPPRRRQVSENMLRLLPERPIEPSRSFEGGNQIL
jgi:hypothetical protein